MNQNEVYVGARYVPVFADDPWSSERKYEPLTVVLHEGSSYTSRQFVPKGIDIGNELFWARTGDYNAQINLLENDIQGISEIVDDKSFAFDTVALMQACENLNPGNICHTNGFHASGDGGAAWYVISDSGTANSMDVIGIPSNESPELYASLVITGDSVTPEMFGAYGDGVHDDTASMTKCFSYLVISCKQNSTYLISSQVVTNGNKCVYGNSSKILLATQTTDYNDYAFAYTDANGVFIENLSIVTQSHNLTDFSVPSGHSKAINETSSGWHGIRFRHCSNVLIQNCYFEGLGFGIAVLPGEYASEEINASKNINIKGNYFYNVKNCYIFEYCNYVDFDGNKHVLDIPASDGFHVYYLEAYVGHVTISNEITICNPNKDTWVAYDFASYGGLEENVGRIITLSNVQAEAPRFFGTYGNYDIEANGCTFKSNAISTTTINMMFLDHADDASIRFNACRLIYSSNAPAMLLLSYAVPESESEAVFTDCYIEMPRLLMFTSNQNYVTSYATFKGCKIVAVNSSLGLTPVPVHGYLNLIDCNIEGNIGWTPSFITGQSIACDSIVNISKCTFTTLASSSPASILGVINNMPTINIFGCQLLIPNTLEGGGLFRTQPTNKANNYSRYTLDQS